MGDPFGQALLDHYRKERHSPLLQRDGESVYTHHVEEFYFMDFWKEPDPQWVSSWLEGPLLDVGAGAGRDVLHFQNQFETIALEHTEPLVTLLAERGVKTVEMGDMLDLPATFPPDRFRSVLFAGAHIGFVKSRSGLRNLLRDLSVLTMDDATVVFDCYDPNYAGASQMLGYRPDTTPGLAFRVYHYEYEEIVGETKLSRLFSPEQLHRTIAPTVWSIADINRPRNSYHMQVALAK